MRLWHKDLIAILPREQLIAQWRELSAIAGAIQTKGTPNHMLVNFVLDYDYDNFITYAKLVREELTRRNYKTMDSVWNKITALKPDWNLMPIEDVYFRKMNDFYFDVLWPDNSSLVDENVLNNNSIVCKMNYKKFSMLFTGDIEEIAEKQILQEYKNNVQLLKSTILKVAHHGSKTSSIKEFVNAVNPKIALIGVGENNKFGHPNEDILTRLKTRGTRIYRTDQNGEILVMVDKKGVIKLKKYIN